MRKLLLKMKGTRTLARFALLQSEKTLEEVKNRDKIVDQVAMTSRLLREENHFRETIRAALKW